MELKQKTELSSRTLAKHLNKMADLQIIKRKTDVESGKYPIPVLYKASPKLTIYMKSGISREQISDRMISLLSETKDPLIILDEIHASSQEYFIELLTAIKQNEIITNEEIGFFAENFLWANYKQYISKLLEASRKIVDDLNITQLLINRAKRQTRISEETLKIYEKIEQQKSNRAREFRRPY